MKAAKILLFLLLSGTIFSSCVSNRKYQEALWRRQDVEQDYNHLQMQYASLKSERDELENSSSRNIHQKDQQLADNEQALNDENRKLQEMNSLLASQRDAIRNLKQEVCSALKCFTPDELSIEIRDGKLYVSLSDKLLFPSGSDVVNARGKEALTMLGAVLANSDLEIMIEGHTDPVPIASERNKDNWDLSVHRATSVSRILIDDGIPPQRIIASGRAYFHPLASNETAEGRQQNRRTELVLSPKLDKLWKLTEQGDNLNLSKVSQ